MPLRPRHVIPTALAAAAAAVAVGALQDSTPDASAQSGERVELADVLAQLRRNAKVSERLNAGFFRAPQTRQYVGSAFHPVDDDIAYTADHGDFSLSLDPTRPGTQVVAEEVRSVPQTTGTFEIPLDIPNRAEVVAVAASYRDVQGNNAEGAPSGLGFSVVKVGQLGDGAEEQLALPQGADAALGFRSTDGATQALQQLPLRNNGFRVDNSRNRYVLRVRIDDTSENTRFHGFTIQYVIGRGVPGAPATGEGGQ